MNTIKIFPISKKWPVSKHVAGDVFLDGVQRDMEEVENADENFCKITQL